MTTARSLLVLALALFAVPATARRNDDGWVHLGAPAAETRIELAFALQHAPEGVAALKSELLARSTPWSPLYGQWLSNDAVHEIVAPRAGAADAVRAHLAVRRRASPPPNSPSARSHPLPASERAHPMAASALPAPDGSHAYYCLTKQTLAGRAPLFR
jgi:hypothetical protein